MYRNDDLKTHASSRIAGIARDLKEEVRKHRNWHFLEGVLFLIAGIVAIVLPGVTAMAAELVVGVSLCIGGLMRLTNAFNFPTGRWWRTLSGAIFLAAGSSMLWWPAAGIASLVLITGAFLLVEGTIEIFLSLTYRPLFRWGALLVSGLISLALGGLIFTFPVTGIIYIAIAIGLSMIFYGLSLLTLTWKTGS
jgi:uncharacterized membrane protein HdeD (DUF308 family)